MILCCLLVLLAVHGSYLQKVDYKNYHIVQSINHEDLIKALNIGDNEDELLKALTPDNSALLLEPSTVQKVIQFLNHSSLEYNIVTRDLQGDIDNEVVPDTNWFKSYHQFDHILNWLKDLSLAYPDFCSLFDIGKSHEGRPLTVLKITGAPNHCKQKPSIWIDSGIHAREWITHSTASYIIEKLMTEYITNEEVKKIRDSYDFYFLVTMNPDGYVYSWETDRLWRKSRKPNSNSNCIGTDTNRNFDFKWNSIGTSPDPCSQTYAGPKAFSDPEAKAVADFIMKNNLMWEIFLTVHSYGHLMLAPWGYTHQLPDNYPDLEYVGTATVKAIKEVHGVEYKFGTSANILYQSSGTGRDWAKGVAKIPFVYTFELRSNNSFIIPPTEIIPTGEEMWAGFKTIIQKVKTISPPFCKPYKP